MQKLGNREQGAKDWPIGSKGAKDWLIGSQDWPIENQGVKTGQ